MRIKTDLFIKSITFAKFNSKLDTMKKIFLVLMFLGISTFAFSQKQLALKSSYDFEQTLSRLRSHLNENGISIFAEIDHSDEAKRERMPLPPTKVLIVGNPKVGTKLMQENQAIALYLPLKVLVFQKDGNVEIHYQKITKLSRKNKIRKTLEISKKIDETMEIILKKVAL